MSLNCVRKKTGERRMQDSTVHCSTLQLLPFFFGPRNQTQDLTRAMQCCALSYLPVLLPPLLPHSSLALRNIMMS